MSKKLLLTTVLCLVCKTLFAQEELQHHDVNFAVGAAVPTGSDTSYLQKAPMILLTYGYRFNRLFQAEGGLQMAFGAANNRNPEESEFGTVAGGDHEFMLPFSGRIIAPLPFERWQVSAGGGPVYLHYSETSTSGSQYCFSCTSRGGWGLQGSMKIRYLLGEEKNYHVGTVLQYVSGSLNGDAVGNIPATKTTDHWYNVLLELGFNF